MLTTTTITHKISTEDIKNLIVKELKLDGQKIDIQFDIGYTTSDTWAASQPYCKSVTVTVTNK